MLPVTCPSCGHAFVTSPQATTETSPDASVVQWFRTETAWLGEMSTAEVYESYLGASDQPPVSRARFVADLAYLGVDELMDDETFVLLRR